MTMITGLDSNGRITPNGVNVVIPAESAGIGDLIFKSGSIYKVIGCGTASGQSITIGSTTYNIYGGIYGFVNGEAMVVAPNELPASYWGAYVSGMPIISTGSVLMRNGKRTSYYVQMNTAQNSNYIKGGSTIPVQLASAYQATSLTADTFLTDTSDDAKEVRRHFATWDEYIRQTLRVQGAPGSPFGAVTTGVKVHEFGRWFGKMYAGSQEEGTALRRCYDYGEGDGSWWLASMFELGEQMIDAHLDRLNMNPTNVFANISKSSHRWSCVLRSTGNAWSCNSYGMSSNYGISANQFAVRPVTLFKLK